jgi:hypothetical protein
MEEMVVAEEIRQRRRWKRKTLRTKLKRRRRKRRRRMRKRKRKRTGRVVFWLHRIGTTTRRRYTQQGIRECAVDISRDGVLGVSLRHQRTFTRAFPNKREESEGLVRFAEERALRATLSPPV